MRGSAAARLAKVKFMADEVEDTSIYVVVVNHEEQYSVWPVGRSVPVGWTEVQKRGTKQDCLGYIKEVWTDMRPLSLRRAMDALKTPTPVKAKRAAAPARTRKPATKKGKRR